MGIPSDCSLGDRVPATRISHIPSEVLNRLSEGFLSTKNLAEWLACNRRLLLRSVFRDLQLSANNELAVWVNTVADDESYPIGSQAIGEHLSQFIQPGDAIWKRLSTHHSDVVREWAAIVVSKSQLTFPRKLAWIKLFADDENPNLREVAWRVLRPNVLAEPEACIRALVPWTGSRNERLRRFAIEVTRPCGAWSQHCSLLMQEPHRAISLLEPLRADDSEWVQNSMVHWLKDAGRNRSDWVRELLQRWAAESPRPETDRIVQGATKALDEQAAR